MPPDVEHLTAPEQLDTLLLESSHRPLLLFKHSQTCGTSAQALDELAEYLEQADAGGRYAVVTVQTHRAVSNAVAERFGVRHETPQALLVMDGRVVWHASHYGVTAHAIAKAIAAHRGQAAPA